MSTTATPPATGTSAPSTPPSAVEPAAPRPVSYASAGTGAPFRRGPNWRLIGLVGGVGALFAAVLYGLVSPLLSGGIVNRGNYMEVDLKALGYFPFEPDGRIEDVPARFRALDGKRVVMQGYMYSPESAGDRGTAFQFVYNVQKCCFGGPPKVQERVYGHTTDPAKIYDWTQFVEVTGILHVRVVRGDDGTIHSVYDMDVEKAKAL